MDDPSIESKGDRRRTPAGLRRSRRIEDVTSTERTLVIVMAQVVAILALLVVWWVLRTRRCCGDTGTEATDR